METKKAIKSLSIEPNQKIPFRFIVKDGVEKLYRLGHSGTRKRSSDLLEPKWHKCLRYIIGLMYLTVIIKSAIFILLYMTLSEDEADNERIFVYLGEYAHELPQIRLHWNVSLIQPFMMCFNLHQLHLRNDYVNTEWSELLDCLTGYLKPSEIGLKNAKDIQKILKM